MVSRQAKGANPRAIIRVTQKNRPLACKAAVSVLHFITVSNYSNTNQKG